MTPKAFYAVPDRFNAGEFVVKNRRNEVVAMGFESMAAAEAWIAERTR